MIEMAEIKFPAEDEIKARIAAKNNAILEIHGERIRQEYGALLKNDDVVRVYETEEMIKQCQECSGLPCKYARAYTPKIKTSGDYVSFYYNDCRYIKAQNRQESLERNLRNSKIPAQYQNLSFDDYIVDEGNRDAIRKAKYCIAKGIGLYLYGKPGVGKTMLAAIIANESLKLNRRVIFSKVADLLRNIRQTYQKDSKLTDLDILQELYDSEVLIIDDMRPERGKKFVGETLFDVIDYRYNAKKQTIITSNGSLEEVCKALNNPEGAAESLDGTRIYDRCKDMMILATIKGESRRGVKKCG